MAEQKSLLPAWRKGRGCASQLWVPVCMLGEFNMLTSADATSPVLAPDRSLPPPTLHTQSNHLKRCQMEMGQRKGHT